MTSMAIILLGGLKHCGKSTLGRIVAEDLGYRFYDLDDIVLMQAGGVWKSVREIYRDGGRGEFLRIEAEAARVFLEWHIPDLQGQGAILSLGGGTVENDGAMAWIGRVGYKVYIRADRDMLFKRIMNKGRPPFLSGDNPEGDWARVYERRNRLYEEFAEVIHDVDEAEAKINAQRLLVRLQKSEIPL